MNTTELDEILLKDIEHDGSFIPVGAIRERLPALLSFLDTEIAKAKIEQVESLLHYANNDDMMAVDIPHLEWVLATLKADTESNGQNTGTSTYTTPLPGAKFLDTPTKDTESIQGGE